MPIEIMSKRVSEKTIKARFENALVIDVTSKSKDKYLQLSPFYPHGNIPVPFSGAFFSKTVEGIWQGLKVFEAEDVDVSKFQIDSMKGIKRTVRKLGKPLGHREGVNGSSLLGYIDARAKIYRPSFEYILKHKVFDVVRELSEVSQRRDVVLLDYATNQDIFDAKSPLSHAGLIKHFIDHRFSFDFG
jgi:hypothetical protein